MSTSSSGAAGSVPEAATGDQLGHRVGFMQGRMSAMISGRIQAFPWSSWRDEFSLGAKHGFRLLEWTLDQDRLYENPLLTTAGQDEIRQLMRQYGVGIPSLTGDCFMQAPFWKECGQDRERLKRDFLAVADACGRVGISMLVVPLVDDGRIETSEQEAALVEFLRGQQPYFRSLGLRLIFESDLDPAALVRFIGQFDSESFGINYDIGNSAALGFNPAAEIATYGHRILNVHVKDRKLAGTTVPLGSGAADFQSAFRALRRAGYAANFILQTARASDGDHVGALCRYRDMTVDWLRCV